APRALRPRPGRSSPARSSRDQRAPVGWPDGCSPGQLLLTLEQLLGDRRLSLAAVQGGHVDRPQRVVGLFEVVVHDQVVIFSVVRELRASHFEPLCDQDRKSTRLNSSHVKISYAVFCLKKKKK